MAKWIGKNLAPLLVFPAALFYLFGNVRIGVRSQFLHTEFLGSTSGYEELSLAGFIPLYEYLIWLTGLLGMFYFICMFWAPNRGINAAVRVKKLHRAILCGLFLNGFQVCPLLFLQAHRDLIIRPQSTLTFWIWGGNALLLLALLVPSALALAYVKEQNHGLQIPYGETIQSKSVIAITLGGSILNLLFYSAEFRGFVDASKAREIFIGQTDQPELKDKRLFLLDRNESLYAILTSQQPEDKRTILFVRKDKYPIILLGESVPIMQRIGER